MNTIAPSRRVKMLDPQTINQIAAGEVVERPASVIKELLENALDAGATRVEIELATKGESRMTIRDDGCGMTPDDMELALQRHATSKISSVLDLGQLTSLGFRGEALPSIASVSRLTLASATEDGVRHRIQVEGGVMTTLSPVPGPKGTEISVEDLFFNTPARLKFLKTDATELSACVEVVQRAALAAPAVSLTLIHNGRIAMQTAGDADLRGAVAEVWSREIAGALVPLDSAFNGVRVRGFVSPPHLTKGTRGYQWLFVNGRPIRSRALTVAIDQAYHMLTPEKRYAVAILILDVDPSRVDANVSPTKTEVKFQFERQIFDAVRHSIKAALLEHGMVPDASALARANEALAAVRANGVYGAPSIGGSSGYSAATVQAYGQIPFPIGTSAVEDARINARDGTVYEPEFDRAGSYGVSGSDGVFSPIPEAPITTDQIVIAGPPPDVDEDSAGEASESLTGIGDLLNGLRIIGQSMNTFIIAENHQGLLIIDQHVAHERILFEMLRRNRGQVPVETQALLVPETIHLDSRVAIALEGQLEELRTLGFHLEAFGGGTFLIRAVPAALKGKNPKRMLQEIAEELVEGFGSGNVVPARETLWIMCSCKMAIKAGDPLTMAEMEKLMYDLALTENPFLCPHGRPITVVIGKGDLLRKFKR